MNEKAFTRHVVPAGITPIALSMLMALGSVIASAEPLSASPSGHEDLLNQVIATPAPLPTKQILDLSQLPAVADVDLLAINDDIKTLLDQHIAPISSGRDKTFELHRLLFKSFYLGIRYEYGKTKTAQETFDSGSGNCLSHAALFVAAAKYVGLKAYFQMVDVPREWLDRDSFYVVPGHMNVAVRMPGNTITVEFADILLARDTQNLASTRITERQALAEYYNNIGMEYLEQRNDLHAIAFMRKSTSTYNKVAAAWSNLGVTYKLNGHLQLAQDAYENGLRHDKRNLSIINNAYILYQQTNQLKKAERLARKVERYSKKNPYYLEKLASTDMSLGNYEQAVNLLKKAVRIKNEEARFHIALAYAYYQLGDYDSSIESATLAQQHSQTPEEYKRYQAKLDLLRTYRAGL